MPILLNSKNIVYLPVTYQTEKEFEATTVALADQIFGPSTIYVDVKKRIAGNNIITIPDGYLIDTTEPDLPKLFVIETEIVGHDPFKHIGIQMLKFVTSFEDARRDIRNFLMEEIQREPVHLERLENGLKQSSHRNIDAYLDKAVFSEFRGIVIIDEVREELNKVLEKINANISVIEFKSFRDEGGELIHQFDTLYQLEEDREPVGPEKKRTKLTLKERKARLLRRAACDTVVVPAREEGFNNVFLGQNQWFAIRIGAAMKEKLKWIAGYQVAPVSAVTHIAEISEIRPYKDTGKYMVKFKGVAEKLERSISIKSPHKSPQGSVYVRRDTLLKSKFLDDALE